MVSLRNFSPQECDDYLRARGVDPAEHARLFRITHGHPLGLSLVADVVSRGGEAAADPLSPDLVGTLVRQFVGVVPSGMHRRTLEVCALARVSTEALLRDALDLDDTGELFAWLRGLSFAEPGPGGLFPHDLARDVLDVDLRWRDPEGYRQVFRGVRAHIHRRLETARGVEQQRALFDEKFLFRNLPSILSPVDWESWGRHYPQPARDQDREAITGMARGCEGGESAVIAERWLDRQPGGVFVLRRPDGSVRGFVALLDLTRASADDLAADPGALDAWDFARRHAPPRPGETVTLTRFVVDGEVYQEPSPTMNATPILTIQRYLQIPQLAWDFLALAEPERWDAYFEAADIPRARDADFVVGGRRYGLFAHDFRQVPVDAWLELVTERALAQDFTLPPQRPPQPLVQSQQEFADAVRQALRDLHRPDLLARSPLLRTRLLRDRTGNREPGPALLEGTMREAIGSLRAQPRDDKLYRAVAASGSPVCSQTPARRRQPRLVAIRLLAPTGSADPVAHGCPRRPRGLQKRLCPCQNVKNGFASLCQSVQSRPRARPSSPLEQGGFDASQTRIGANGSRFGVRAVRAPRQRGSGAGRPSEQSAGGRGTQQQRHGALPDQ